MIDPFLLRHIEGVLVNGGSGGKGGSSGKCGKGGKGGSGGGSGGDLCPQGQGLGSVALTQITGRMTGHGRDGRDGYDGNDGIDGQDGQDGENGLITVSYGSEKTTADDVYSPPISVEGSFDVVENEEGSIRKDFGINAGRQPSGRVIS